MIRAVLADDEVLARQKLRQLLREHSDVEVVGEGATASETIELVRAANPDLLFLDIRMPGMDGFDVIGELSSLKDFAMPSVIFTTAHDSYALRAFEIHAADYLLKPFTLERLRLAVQRVVGHLKSDHFNNGEQGADHSGRVPRNGHAYSTRIVFKSRGRILFLPVSDIRWIRAEENYVRICAGSETHLLRETMARMEERLDPQMFLRVHRSWIVNLQFLKEVRSDPNGEFVVILIDGHKLPMSRTYHSRVSELLIRH
jgi:two-component system LytT family response regulator